MVTAWHLQPQTVCVCVYVCTRMRFWGLGFAHVSTHLLLLSCISSPCPHVAQAASNMLGVKGCPHKPLFFTYYS